jgi:CRISPR/Cas system-associated exonuclease Cas4 (RecB family)
MSQYYNSSRDKNVFNPLRHGSGQVSGGEPFKLSRSKIDLFIECPRCFYLDRRLGVGRPPGFPFNLNSAVDFLLKKEFDIHRAAGEAHPLMENYGLDLVPFSHPRLDEWRENFKGVQFYYEPANIILTGAVDDIWVDKNGMLYVVDYKSTSKDTEVNLDAPWQIGYKRQMEFYQWLLRKNGFKVSDTGYFVYCNGRKDVKAFDAKLEFDVKIIPYEGSDNWVEKTILEAKKCLMSDTAPDPSLNCDYCSYRKAAYEKENLAYTKSIKNEKKSVKNKIKIQKSLI